MIVVNSILFIITFFLIAVLLGKGIEIKYFKGNNGIVHQCVTGMLMMFSIFHVEALVSTFIKLSLTSLMSIYLLSLVSILIYLCNNRWKYLLTKQRCKHEKTQVWIKVIVLVLIAFQGLWICGYSHVDADDATYVGIATTSFFSNTLNQTNHLTGAIMNTADFADYILAPFPLFWAMWAKIYSLHPAYLMHTLCPIVLIILAYSVYYLVGKVLFKREQDSYIFLFFICILNIWGNWAIRSTATFLLFRIWQGKAVLATVLIPLTIYLMADIKTNDNMSIKWFFLLLNGFSCCFVSGMGAFLFPILLLSYAIPDLLIKRNWRNIVKYFICIIPCVISLGLYIVLKMFI